MHSAHYSRNWPFACFGYTLGQAPKWGPLAARPGPGPSTPLFIQPTWYNVSGYVARTRAWGEPAAAARQGAKGSEARPLKGAVVPFEMERLAVCYQEQTGVLYPQVLETLMRGACWELLA